MREYPVPFSTKEETSFMAGLTVREMLWLGGGFILGLFGASLLFLLLRAETRNMIICLPAVVPCVLASLYLARKKVTEEDRQETLDRHYYKAVRFKYRPHIYLNYRKEGS
jgi:hypothetical protein